MTDTLALPARSRFLSWWTAPDAALADAGAEGELTVARVRLGLGLAILGVPVAGILTGQAGPEYRLAGLFATLTFLGALMVYRLALRRQPIPWLGFATSVTDVSIVSLLTASYLMAGMPSVAANSRTTFACYLLAIAATALRWDVRICVLAGALATVQYGLIAAAAWVAWSPEPTLDTLVYGEIVPGQQIARLLILGGATLIAVAVVRQSSALRLSATHDALTGLKNRSYFRERLAQEMERAERTGRPLSLALLDVDRFKQVNDVHGHAAGDAVLRQVAAALRDGLRRTDLVGRYGGEEFVLALPETAPDSAVARLEQLRERIAALRVPHPSGGAPIAVTASLGLAGWPADARVMDALIHAADERLLAAKAGGRNRLVHDLVGVSDGAAAGHTRTLSS